MAHSAMYERIKRLYDTNKLDTQGVQNAITRGWITQEEAETILSGQDYAEN